MKSSSTKRQKGGGMPPAENRTQSADIIKILGIEHESIPIETNIQWHK
jgi:hypothetical protein